MGVTWAEKGAGFVDLSLSENGIFPKSSSRQPHFFRQMQPGYTPDFRLFAICPMKITPFMRVSINWYSAESFSMQSLIPWCRILGTVQVILGQFLTSETGD